MAYKPGSKRTNRAVSRDFFFYLFVGKSQLWAVRKTKAAQALNSARTRLLAIARSGGFPWQERSQEGHSV